MRSATSTVGLLIRACAVSAIVAVESDPQRQSCRAGRWRPADVELRRADSALWLRYPCAPSEPEWCAGPRHLRACELQSSAAYAACGIGGTMPRPELCGMLAWKPLFIDS